MKKFALITGLCVLFAALVLCTACEKKNPGGDDETVVGTDTEIISSDVTEPGTGEETPTETDTAGESDTIPPINEDVTAIPRYDYFEADVSKDVTVDKAVYSDMKLTLPKALLISDEQVQAYITQTVFQYRTPDNASQQVTDVPIKKGDSAFIWYKGYMDGVEFAGGSNWDDETPFELGIGSGALIPGFEDGLIGVIPKNATKETPFDLHVTFPENYANADLKGKEAVFKVAIAYTVQYTVPAYTRDFVENTLLYEAKEKTYPSEAAFFAEYEGYIRDQLEAQNAESVEYAKNDAMWTFLTSTCECRNLSQIELDFYYNSYVSEIEYYFAQYSYYYGESFTSQYPDIASFAIFYMGLQTGADWQAELHHMAELMVKKDMISHAIAEIEGIETVTDEEFNKEVAYWVNQYQGYMSEAEIIQSMGELYLRESALAAKMNEWLMGKCTFTFED